MLINVILIMCHFSSAQQAQNNAAAAAVHAAIHLKEIPEESVRHEDYATNHNYHGNGPNPPAPTANGAGTSPDFDFAGYK